MAGTRNRRARQARLKRAARLGIVAVSVAGAVVAVGSLTAAPRSAATATAAQLTRYDAARSQLVGLGARSHAAPAAGTVTAERVATGSRAAGAAASGAVAVCRTNPAGRQLLEVSIAEQRVWACDGTTLASTSPVTTGAYALANVDEATPTGTWAIQGKSTDVHLTGCNLDGCWDDYVHYWLPFNGPFGFHDAPWQTFAFGSPKYALQGSHGCVHLPESEAAWVYRWAQVGTTVTITA
jgi:lipoprotein-anchoring transpeptidase ErfK/SrfK